MALPEPDNNGSIQEELFFCHTTCNLLKLLHVYAVSILLSHAL